MKDIFYNKYVFIYNTIFLFVISFGPSALLMKKYMFPQQTVQMAKNIDAFFQTCYPYHPLPTASSKRFSFSYFSN